MVKNCFYLAANDTFRPWAEFYVAEYTFPGEHAIRIHVGQVLRRQDGRNLIVRTIKLIYGDEGSASEDPLTRGR